VTIGEICILVTGEVCEDKVVYTRCKYLHNSETY